jgi:hypothetical protein
MNMSWNCIKGSVSANVSAEPIQEEETLDNEEEVVNPEVVPEVRAASCQL